MSTLGRTTLLWMIPVNLVLVAWVWIGRIVFGVGGWFFLSFTIALAGAAIALAGYVVLLGALVFARRPTPVPA